MNSFAIVLICAQACLLQTAFGQFLGAMGGPVGCAPGAAVATAGFANPGLAVPYGSIGYGARVGNCGYGGLGGAYGTLGGIYGPGLAGPLGTGLGGPLRNGLVGPLGLGIGRGRLL